MAETMIMAEFSGGNMSSEQILQPSDSRYRVMEKELKQTLNVNLNCLDKTYPKMASLFRNTIRKSPPSLKIAMLSGKVTSLVLVMGEYQSENMLDPMFKIKSEEEIESYGIKNGTVPLLFGVTSGYDLLMIHGLTETSDPIHRDLRIENPIYVIEIIPERLLLYLLVFDMTSIFNRGKISFFLGALALADFADYLMNPDVRYPDLLIYHGADGRLVKGVRDLIDQCRIGLEKNFVKHMEDIKSYYRSLSANHWRTCFGSNLGRPLRIIGLTSIYTTFLQYATRDLLEGFKELGHKIEILIEHHHTHRLTNHSVYQRVSEFKPDLILILDHFRWESNLGLLEDVPVVTWIQDVLDNIVTDRTDVRLTERDFVFSFSKLWLRDGTFDRPLYRDKKIHFLPVGINTSVYFPDKTQEKEIDCLYVTHLINPTRTLLSHRSMPSAAMGEPRDITIGGLKTDSIVMKKVFRSIINKIDSLTYRQLCEYFIRHDLFHSIGLEAFEKYGIDGSTVPKEFLSGFNSPIHMEVLSMIKALPMIHLFKNGINIKIYGNNWDRYTELKPVLQGPAGNGLELNRLMNKSRICISNSAGTTLHMRA
ncbi:MAG TPA: hypothetical protein HPQ00_15605, partial [Magnetococcales bacterium]|nr:hypothetical protein [Magnetococcales bacterium]